VQKFGLKLWSTNKQYIQEAIRLYKNGWYDYIELFAVPNSYSEYINLWKQLTIPYLIHAPHFSCGLNLAKKEAFKSNMQMAADALRFADDLGANVIIFHPGIDGDINETVHQLHQIKDSRIVVENKPYYALNNLICNGYSPEEIKFVMDNTGVGFCFDIGHAIYSANAQKIDPVEYLKRFNGLGPKLYHVCDGDWNGVYDEHKHFGDGSFNFEKIVPLFSAECLMSLETEKSHVDSLKDFEGDVVYVRSLLKPRSAIKILPASLHDIADVFSLSNEDDVRHNSINVGKITWDNHVIWFNEKISSKDCCYFVVKNEQDNFVGQVRFDKVDAEQEACVISVSLRKEFRGKGLGTTVLVEGAKQLFKNSETKKIYAYIKPENMPSIKAFRKVGYAIIGQTILNDVEFLKLEYTRPQI
jgi:deoxyribonuclease IV